MRERWREWTGGSCLLPSAGTLHCSSLGKGPVGGRGQKGHAFVPCGLTQPVPPLSATPRHPPNVPGAQSQPAALQGNLRSLSHQSPVKEAREEPLMAGSKGSRGGGPSPAPNTTPTASNPAIYPECNPEHSPSPVHQQTPLLHFNSASS